MLRHEDEPMAKAATHSEGDQLVTIAGRRLRVSNLDKVMYPDSGTTKGEVLAYYTQIAPLMIPHVTGRPATRKRWVDGVGSAEHPESSFFAKDLGEGAPAWVHRRSISHSEGAKDYPLIDDVPTLVWLAQTASLEIHVPQWRFGPGGEAPNPDRIVFDLDPGPGVGLAECAEVARLTREILSGIGLDPMPVTSGSKGLHLYAALPGEQTSDQVSAIAHELARALEADHPGLVVSSMKRALRDGRVLIDWSQNNQAKTTIAPYSLRGLSLPWVAAPRTWDELAEPGLAQLTLDEVLTRAAEIGDPLAALGFHAGGRESAHGPLATYIAKRTAGKTPEPVPSNALGAAASIGEKPRFVIQEHHATRLHWDFRLEHDGVFVSWAVPKGVPATSTRNNLAVMTEDHPMEYGSFEGTIPHGEYGAGTVTIWDDGRYELEKWRDDEVIVTVEGRPGGPLGRVRLALIRTDGEGEKSTWLLHRMKTDASGAPQPDGVPVAASVQAGDEPDGDELAGHGEGSVNPPDPKSQPKAAGVPSSVRVKSGPKPMLASNGTRAEALTLAPGAPPWVEFKWDGIRAVGVWDDDGLRLFTRGGNDVTGRYPEITGSSPGFAAHSGVVDGEIVALDPRGRPSFSRLQLRMNLGKPREIARAAAKTPVHYYVFDVLQIGDDDLTHLPLAARRERLERLAAGPELAPSIVVPPVFDDVDAALAASREYGLEGVMVKDPRSLYRPGARSPDWLKLKLTHTQAVVIGGVRPGRGERAGRIGSLLLGVPGPAGLEYVGRVGTGFTDAALDKLGARLARLHRATSPFVAVPAAEASDAQWVTPTLVGEVEFAEWTDGGILRQARWRGLRPDTTPAEVVREP